jgi:DNA-directed RNA polymerase specialized sigma24 family protein
VETTVARDAATDAVEDVYRRDGGRLWRALYVFAGDADVADEAVAEAFAQALRRGAAIRDVSGWVWRSAFRLAAADLKNQSQLVHGAMPEPATYDARLDDELLVALQGLTPQQRIVIVLQLLRRLSGARDWAPYRHEPAGHPFAPQSRPATPSPAARGG